MIEQNSWLGRLARASFFTVCLLLCAKAAHAEPSAQNRAAAEVLFDEGGQLFRAGKFEEACAKLAQSQELDPALGTLLNLARCYEKIGRSASAWIAFVDAASAAKAAGQTQREATAREGANRLVDLLPKLLIKVPDSVLVSGLEITRDGEAVPQALWNVPSPTDPGDHAIQMKAPNKKPWSTKVHLEASKQAAVLLPPLEDGEKPTTGPGLEPSGLGAQRVVALVAAGVGVVGLGAGSVFALSAKSDADTANKQCSGDTCNSADALSANDRAAKKANFATVFMAAGAACLAGGAVLWFTAPSRRAEQAARARPPRALRLSLNPFVDAASRGISLEGQF